MRQLAAACAALLVLSGCASGDESDGGDSDPAPKPIDDVCALLPPEEASRIVGVRYADADEPAPDSLFALCSYALATPEAPFTLMVSAGVGDLADVARGLRLAGEVTEEPIDVPGADEASVLATNDGDISVEQVAAAADGNVYVVTFGGSTEVAVRLLTAALGEDVPDQVADPLPDTCAIEARTVHRVLGAPAPPVAVGSEAAWSSCTFDTGTGTSVTVSAARNAGDLDRYLVEHTYLPEGAEPEEITVEGADDARLVTDPAAPLGTVTALAILGDVTYDVEVTDVTQRGSAIATEMLAAAIGRT